MKQQKLSVAIYCRVASFNKDAMQSQKEKLLWYADEQGFEEIAVYTDNGYSGLNLDRPGFKQLEADIEAGKIHAVIANDIYRIARNQFVASGWMEKVEKAGVELLVVN